MALELRRASDGGAWLVYTGEGQPRTLLDLLDEETIRAAIGRDLDAEQVPISERDHQRLRALQSTARRALHDAEASAIEAQSWRALEWLARR